MTDVIQPIRHPRISVPTNNPDDPAFFVQPGTGFDGVVAIARGGAIECTGSLIFSGRHILTAAHCFNIDDVTPNPNPNEAEYTVFFDLPSGRVPIAVSRIFIHPKWEADKDFNNDIAILELAQVAPESADRYQIYTNGDEVFKTITRVGYGNKSTGNTGEVEFDPSPIKRQGLNRYDTFVDIFNKFRGFNSIPSTQLAYDFDNGLLVNDAFGRELNTFDVGLGFREVGSSIGDSGGPSFIEGKIAGIVSYGFRSPIPSIDFTSEHDSSFGEIFVDTRVAVHDVFIAETIVETNKGDDFLFGNNRDDFLTGNAGNDTLEGRGGNDQLFGNEGNDVIEGREGNDQLFGNQGNDAIEGQEANDLLIGGKDSDTMSGGDGNDSLLGNLGNDGLNGDRGDDLLFGGLNDDVLTGGDGSDRLSGDLGRDILIGGFGSDEFILRTAAAVFDPTQTDVIADFAPGDDLIALTSGLTPEGVLLIPAALTGLAGTLIQLPPQPPETPPEQLLPTILGFVSNASPADVTSRLVAISDIL
jgi:Ca2+-binding RTX toxin-like protein